jgi:acetyl esterase/lipase
MGGSAGGNLAAVMALRARDEGGPALVHQVLVVPAVTADDGASESRRLFAAGYGLDGVARMVAAYLPDPADRPRPWASPLLAERFEGLPPALILTAEFDPLRDEGGAYAQALASAGNRVEHVPARGHTHTSITMVGVIVSGASYRAEMARALRQFLGADANVSA